MNRGEQYHRYIVRAKANNEIKRKKNDLWLTPFLSTAML